MAQLVIGLDVGNHAVKVVGLERAMRSFLPVFYDEEPVPQDQDAQGNLLPFPERAARAMEALRNRGHLRADTVVTALPADLATSRLVALPFDDPKKIAATLPFELESAVPFDMEELVYDSVVMKAPETDGVEVLVGMARRDSVQQFLDLLKGAGVEPRIIELQPLALDMLRRHLVADEPAASREPVVTPGGTVIQQGPDAMPSATAVIDIGAAHTNVVVSTGNDVIGARTILRGGQDLTRALSREFGLPLAEAEKGKLKEAYLETPDAPAPYPEQQRISGCLKGALMPLVRELRQTFQGITAQRRVRIRRVLLCGGTSRVPNIERFLAQELNINVHKLEELDRTLAPTLPADSAVAGMPVPQAAAAMALALSGLLGTRSARVDFRQGELAHKGDYEYLVNRAPQLAAGFMCLALLGAFNAYARHFVISRQEAVVAQKQRETCKAILNQDIESGERCISIMREKINPGATGAPAIPDRSALDAYIQVAKAMPKDITVKVESVDITADKLRLKGRTDSFENVDKIVKALEAGECFKRVEKGPARQEGDKVGWSANVDLECSATPAGGAG